MKNLETYNQFINERLDNSSDYATNRLNKYVGTELSFGIIKDINALPYAAIDIIIKINDSEESEHLFINPNLDIKLKNDSLKELITDEDKLLIIKIAKYIFTSEIYSNVYEKRG